MQITDTDIQYALDLADGNELEAAIYLDETGDPAWIHCWMLRIRRHTRQSLCVSYDDLLVALRERTPQ